MWLTSACRRAAWIYIEHIIAKLHHNQPAMLVFCNEVYILFFFADRNLESSYSCNFFRTRRKLRVKFYAYQLFLSDHGFGDFEMPGACFKANPPQFIRGTTQLHPTTTIQRVVSRQMIWKLRANWNSRCWRSRLAGTTSEENLRFSGWDPYTSMGSSTLARFALGEFERLQFFCMKVFAVGKCMSGSSWYELTWINDFVASLAIWPNSLFLPTDGAGSWCCWKGWIFATEELGTKTSKRDVRETRKKYWPWLS